MLLTCVMLSDSPGLRGDAQSAACERLGRARIPHTFINRISLPVTSAAAAPS